MVGGANPVFGGFDTERLAIFEKGLREFLGIVADRFSCGGGVGDDAIVHVGQVHDVIQFESAEFQEAPENILEDKGAIVADVRVVVDRRAASVHAYFPRFLRDKRLDFSGQCVVELDFGHREQVLFLSD